MLTSDTENSESSAAKRPKLDDAAEGKNTTGGITGHSDIKHQGETECQGDPKVQGGLKGQGDTSAAGLKVPLPESFHKDSRLTEPDVGITEYISKHIGFSAILKQRYSDFIVNEIDTEGEVVRLTDLRVPIETDDTKGEAADLSQISCICEEDKEKLQALSENSDSKESVTIKVSNDKEERTKIHQAIKTCFPKLESSTEEEGLQKFIKVRLRTAGDRKRRWPTGRGDYCRFVLYKENKDTMDAINLISKHLRVKPSLFSYAGTKDRRAKTSQEITVYRVSAESLKNVDASLRNMAIGNFRYCKYGLQLGRLKGNRFVIILRNVTGEDDQIKAAMTSLLDVGFINYYGMQRFGTTSIPTHHIGRALLHSQWKEAVELILQPRYEDDSEMAKCRRVWWETRDAKKALSLVPKQSCIEQGLLQGLIRQGANNYLQALTVISRNTRMMYVHSYQSFVWNSVVSRRIKELGLSPVVGDLVLDTDSVTDPDVRVKPISVTEETVNNYNITDVVLPLPGYDVIIPTNQVADWYSDLLAKDGLDMEKLRHKNKDYSLPGAYRKLVVRPENLSWQCYRYDDVTIPLALSDLDLLNGESQPVSVEDGSLKALKMEMSLPTSCYATMAVREVLKMETSPAYQSTLNTM